MPKRLLPECNIRILGYCCLSLLFWRCNQEPGKGTAIKPDDNRFTKVVVAEGFDEPMAMTFLGDGRVLIVERHGALKSVDWQTKEIKTIATIPVNTKYVSKDGIVTEAEEGLVGIVAHPDFARNHWIYMYYADPKDKEHVLARWELHGDSLYASTKKIILQIPTQREVCCHTGGGMVFDMQGNLYLTVGNNTANPSSGTASYDERPGRSSWDDQRGSGNTNDLRGKILRIHPEDNGTYTIPAGNLFKPGTPLTRPEIYIMGDRNPWRVSIDTKTGFLYWGEVGPDAPVDSVWGSRGYDEFNQARKAGNFGWPYFIGDNRSYVKYNYHDIKYGERFDPAHPVNNSPNNTGLKELPPAQKAFIWYPYSNSDSFPIVGSSGRCAVGGPIYHRDNFQNPVRPWPAYFEGKWIITDFMRGWIIAVTMDKNGNYRSMERLLPGEFFSSTIDMQFSPVGDLYLLEYGSAWFKGNNNSALVRIEYNGGNRKPSVNISADKTTGPLPLRVGLSSKGTIDYDNYDQNHLEYNWEITGPGMQQHLSGTATTAVFDSPGVYTARLNVTDSRGSTSSKQLEIIAGNSRPEVTLNINNGNKSFFFPGRPIEYSLDVRDAEDGSISSGKINPSSIKLNIDYVPREIKAEDAIRMYDTTHSQNSFNAGRYLIGINDCKSCHLFDQSSVGPSFLEVANRYEKANETIQKLAAKVISGGSGAWGAQAMAAHPGLSESDAKRMIRYILSLRNPPQLPNKIPLSGTFTPNVPAGETNDGFYLFRAAYTDKGAGRAPAIKGVSVIELKNPILNPDDADVKKGTQLLTTPSVEFSMIGDGALLGYKKIDLTGIKSFKFLLQATPSSGDIGGNIEVRIDSPGGKLIGKTDMVYSKEIDFASLLENNRNTSKQKSRNVIKQPVDFDELMKLLAIQKVVPVEESGIHDLYFVFKNSEGKSSKPLMQVVEIQVGAN